MTSSSSTIIRIPRTDTDQEDDFILGEVTHSGGSSARGSKPLNLKIVATEGEEPYALTLKHGHINDLRASSSACSLTEWESILSSLFVTASPVEGIEAGAEVETLGKKKSITITIRRRVAGINQRLGALTLLHSPSSEIQLFDWCSQLAISRQTALTSLSTSAAQVADLEARVADLKKQLDELVQSKVEQETELLQKFRALLNEKKAKIRQQQQALSSRARPRSGSQERLSRVIESARSKSRVNGPESRLNEDENEEDEEEEGSAKLGRIGGGRRGTGTATARTNARTARVSRPGKRKAANDVPSSDDDDNNDDDDDAKLEKMDVDEPESEPEGSSKTTTMGQSSSSKTLDHEDVTDNDEDENEEVLNKTYDRNTPDHDDDETASEADDKDETLEAGEKELDVPPPSPPPARRQRTAAASSTATTPRKKTTATAARKGKGEETPTPVSSHTKRAGATATRASQPTAVAAVDEGSETESGGEL